MKILTLNTWQESGPWKDRWEVVFQSLEKCRADVCAFQEVFNIDWAGEIRARVKMPHLVTSGEHSGLIFVSKFPVRLQATHVMKTKSPTEDYLRYALFAEIDAGDRRFALFNTHLSWKLDEGSVRERQVDELLSFIADKSSGLDVAVMGDFNATPASREVKKMSEAGFVDAFNVLHPDDPGLTWSNENPYARGASHPLPDRRIDYLFINGGLPSRLKSMKVVLDRPDSTGVWASDHFGLLAKFKD